MLTLFPVVLLQLRGHKLLVTIGLYFLVFVAASVIIIIIAVNFRPMTTT